MKEEMEDGHFDGDGFYHFKKNTVQIKDAWLDDIDWMKLTIFWSTASSSFSSVYLQSKYTDSHC
ncbi:CD2 antigen cytoplasmic tail-binding protein 2 [Portunus trituberculatus]|uniref:CD2 antigen cytoplasmic tail-binding protein 2 n=1 Tax=Portunus trituberculatus TaxID=210409 RepID=A0A5B7GKC2_PORTR|nr:CD2 antigen cytoplasmic tail-binding protein 2 [Portunus trituberculatus]